MDLPNINLVVIGHKDHGKSTLIGRLLYDSKVIPDQKLQEIRTELQSSGKNQFEFAYILDSLEEERRGGLTIDIVHTPFKSERYLYTIIDCPGHEEFIRKMLTGASQADAAILVVSAKEGIEPQTKEHLFLIKILGVKQLIVAVNKMDTIDYNQGAFKEFSKSLKKMLSSLDYEDVPIVPVSALCGDNVTRKSDRMGWYRGGTLIQVLDNRVKLPQPLSEKPLRCAIQDVYNIEGKKVVVCKVETGVLKIGQPVAVMPAMEEGVVEKIESFGREAKESFPGDSVGIVLKGGSNIRRGHVLTGVGEKTEQTKEFVAELIVFSDFTLRSEDIVTIRVGTSETKSKIEKIVRKIDPVDLTVKEEAPESLKNGEVGRIVFRALQPLYLEEYSDFPQIGRFVILGKRGAVAAGIVLEKRE